MVRDQDIWFSVRDEIETETFPRFHEAETFGNYVSRPRRLERDYTPAARWIKIPLGMEVGFDPGHIVSDANPAPPFHL